MMQDTTRLSEAGDSQRGHLLVGLMVLVAVLMILLTVSGQSWTFLMRRDNEAEMIFRGEQYANAIGFYQKETGQYPLELKVLMQRGPHRHRYIRRLWKDPLSKDGKWGLLFMSPTGKGFINPYATRRDQEQFLAGTFGEQGPGASFGGKSGGLGRRTGGTRSAFGGNNGQEQEEEKAGYSEPLPDNFNLRGGDMAGMPIVGVVHRKKESGLKIYKNQANLNDWAFTLLNEGQDLRMGGSVAPPQGTPRNMGVGDSHTPIFFNPADRPGAPKTPGGRTSPIQERLREMRQKRLEEEAKKKQEEAERKAKEKGDEQPPDEGEPAEDEPDDEDQPPDEDQEEQDPNAPADPNGPQDPNAPTTDLALS